MKIKKYIKHLIIGAMAPLILLINAFLVPEPYSYPLIYLGLAPSKLMPFLQNRELMRELTEFTFGRMTPNFAPMQITILIIFWFVFSVVVSILLTYLIGRYNNEKSNKWHGLR